jgi:hypothetical protein
VELGVLGPGQSARRPVILENALSDEITLQRVETSCDCVVVVGPPVCLAPKQAKAIDVSFDPSMDPEYRGALGVLLTGYLSDGRVAFRSEVRLEVDARLLQE